MSYTGDFAMHAAQQEHMRQQYAYQQSHQQPQLPPQQIMSQPVFERQMSGPFNGYQQQGRWPHDYNGIVQMPPYSMQPYAPHFHPGPGMGYAVHDDRVESNSKARLTRNQVDYLENEYQRNPKPDSKSKKEFSRYLNIHPLKVTNWFQNRRAKTKSMRIQAERAQREADGEAEKDDAALAEAEDEQDDDVDKGESDEDVKEEAEDEETNDENTLSQEDQNVDSEPTVKSEISSALKPASAPPVINSPERLRENRRRMHASVDRAIADARSAQIFAEASEPHLSSQLSSESIPTDSMQSTHDHFSMPTSTEYSMMHMPADMMAASQSDPSAFVPGHGHIPGPIWDPAQLAEANAADLSAPFDFGFSLDAPSSMKPQSAMHSPTETVSNAITPDEQWAASVNAANRSDSMPLQLPQQDTTFTNVSHADFPEQRSGSIAESVTNNLDTMDLRNRSTFSSTSPELGSSGENGVDLASRRRRPRPAALTSVSLRSRSYGAATAASPTFRNGMPSPAGQALRHVRSTGHSLNTRYGSGRVTKSPYTTTFTEAEAYKALMLRNAFKDAGLDTPGLMTAVPMQTSFSNTSMPQNETPVPMAVQMPQQLPVQSPPVTPFNQNFFAQPISSIPTSIQQQYATVAETPPYSAGLLTNSSLDFPQFSPDLASFPTTTLGQILPYTNAEDHSMGNWMYNTQNSTYSLATPIESKEPEFHFHEFTNQQDDGTQTTRRQDRATPRHYAFENRGQRDFGFQ